jgi:hypothetical protein
VKVAILEDDGKELARVGKLLEEAGETNADHAALAAWWAEASPLAAEDKPLVTAATLHGGRRALKLTSYVPAIMAVAYLGLLLYFRSIGGYKALVISGEQASGGVEGPVR